MAEKKRSFEESMARLEEIVTQLEKGEAPLEGTSLMKQCSGLLDKAEQKVVKLSAGPGGKPAEEPFLPGEG